MTTQAHPGRLITFEGGEGTGKTTQIRRLAEYWRGQGRVVVTTREPGGTQGAERICDLLVKGVPGQWDGVSEALLFYAARHDHWRRVIAPALNRVPWCCATVSPIPPWPIRAMGITWTATGSPPCTGW